MQPRFSKRPTSHAITRRAALVGAGTAALLGAAGSAHAQAPGGWPAPPGPPVDRIVAIDPGHGGAEIGAVYVGPSGRAEVLEKDVNLRIALLLADELAVAGYRPLLTRSEDSGVNVPSVDRNGDGRIDVDDDLQARVDVMNDGAAALFISVHNNGAASPRVSGTSTWYSAAHPRGRQSQALAKLAQAELLAGLRAAGYERAIDLGANDDPPLQKPYGHLFLTGPQTPRVARPSEMPGIVGESLFVTSDVEARLLQDDGMLQAIAAAYRRAVDAYFQLFPE